VKIVWCAVLVMTVVPANVRSDRPPFSLALGATQRRLKRGTDVCLLVTVTNTSGRDMKIVASPGTLPEDWFRYEIHVRDATGRALSPNSALRDRKTGIVVLDNVARQIPVDTSFVDQVTVTKAYDLRRPGKYKIYVSRPADRYNVSVEGVAPDDLSRRVVNSNTVTVTVVPYKRNPAWTCIEIPSRRAR